MNREEFELRIGEMEIQLSQLIQEMHEIKNAVNYVQEVLEDMWNNLLTYREEVKK